MKMFEDIETAWSRKAPNRRNNFRIKINLSHEIVVEKKISLLPY